ncbi:MAG: PEP/pyruvate-binding domain-containing protein [Bacteroidales bacterium]|nr:PEP/pyruvate-binding domain-containing protein [Bacteroidales bacterium]
MSNIPKLKDIVLRDTPFAELMNKRIFNVLLIATKYDAFMLEDDGRVDEQIFNEYTALSLRYPPRFTQVTNAEQALAELADRNFELIIVMPNMDNSDIFAEAKDIKRRYPHIPIVVLTPFSREVSKRVAREDLSGIDYVFSWLGNSELLLAIIKLLEDKWNAPNDSASVGVQIILLVEDSIRFYSSALPHLYRIVLEQSQEFSKEALNDHLKTMRMRGRPKIMLARTYEEAIEIYKAYKENILGVISDMSFSHKGEKDPTAGFELCSYFKAQDPHVPIILESSEAANIDYARRLGSSFIIKNSKQYPQALKRQVMAHFGFGDFIIIDPASGKEIMRIRDLQDLQRKLKDIPDESLRYHLSHNHFSRFFFSRAMFPPAVILKKVDVCEYKHMEEARQLIANLIVGYRKMKNEGVVAIYQKERFDEYSNFARIGNGSLGGKGRGLAFMGTMVKRYPKLERERFSVNIPKTVVICTDIFDEFMESNNLYPIALSDASDEVILAAFEEASLPNRLLDDLVALFEVVHNPIAVRSSSLLEDSHYQPFAGIYKTYMIPKVEEKTTMLRLLRSAIKAVYASVFYRDSKAYLTATQNLIDQEKMAIVLQEVVGSKYKAETKTGEAEFFYPTLSGVARSLNFYPIGDETAEDGIANVAFGLGKYIVDGGQTLRFSPRHPHHILQLSTTEFALRETQRFFYALDLKNMANVFQTDDAFNLSKVMVKDAENHGSLRFVVSTYDPYDQVIREGFYPGGRKIISYANILQHDQFPLADTIDRLLHIGRAEMGRPVEIEFAMNIEGEQASFYLLQIRPIVDNKETVDEDLSLIAPEETVVTSVMALGNGIVTDVFDVIYVKTAQYNAADNPAIAREVEKLNAALTEEGRSYVLVGPGRWGSSDSWLGIPVKWPHICNARVIVECGLENYRVDPSQGTHFFQNLTSFGVGYFTINPYCQDGAFDEAWLDAQPVLHETAHLRHVRCEKPFVIKMDGHHSRGVVMKP